MIYPRPLKYVLGKIVPFSGTDKIPIENMPADILEIQVSETGGVKTSDEKHFELTTLLESILDEQRETNKLLRKIYK
jgi:hypothetical protein